MSYNDAIPPQVFATITSNSLNYDLDTVEFLIKQEIGRRNDANQPPLSAPEIEEFRRQLIRKLIISGDANAALQLRPITNRQQLNG